MCMCRTGELQRLMFTPQYRRMSGPVFKAETDNECGQFAEACH